MAKSALQEILWPAFDAWQHTYGPDRAKWVMIEVLKNICMLDNIHDAKKLGDLLHRQDVYNRLIRMLSEENDFTDSDIQELAKTAAEWQYHSEQNGINADEVKEIVSSVREAVQRVAHSG